MDIGKNDVFTVRIEDMSEDGAGIGRLDGFIWFVKDTVIGDTVEAKAMKLKKTYGFARLVRVIEPSPHRVTPPCPVARQCGGCQLQAMSYEEQLRFKENKILGNLARIGGFRNIQRVDENGEPEGKRAEGRFTGERLAEAGQSEQGATETGSFEQEPTEERMIPFYPIIGMDEPWHYRNKAQFPVGRTKTGEIVTGFYAGRTHDIIGQDDCLLGVSENREILAVVREYMEKCHIRPYDETAHQGLVRHVLIRKGFATGELMVCLVINGRKLPSAEHLVSELCKLPGMMSVSYSINTEKTNVIMGRETVNLYGPGYITDSIGNIRYRISPLSFYQVNPVQTERLYRTALEYADLTGNETVWDLYCGIGTISLFLAQKAKQVYGVEIIPAAIEDARENARENGLTNVEFFVGKAEEVLPEQYEKNRIRADVIVVDPPRKGCDAKCLETILKMQPERIVYVSCDSATLARDLRILCDGGYEVRKARGSDMFPMTVHCECAVRLEKRSVEKQ